MGKKKKEAKRTKKREEELAKAQLEAYQKLAPPQMDDRHYRYSFGLACDISLGISSHVHDSMQPDVDVEIDEIRTNAPCTNFVYLNSIKTANITTMVGKAEDAFNYAKTPVHVQYPRLSVAHRFAMTGDYTGKIPPSYRDYENRAFKFCLTAFGSCRMTSLI